jgi:hypothetical protein
MVGIILLWYCWNSFSFMMVVLFGSVICSSVVMLSSSSWCRYFLFRFGVIVEWLVAFYSHIVARGVSVCGCDVLSVCMCALPLCFRRYSILVVGECRHASFFSRREILGSTIFCQYVIGEAFVNYPKST